MYSSSLRWRSFTVSGSKDDGSYLSLIDVGSAFHCLRFLHVVSFCFIANCNIEQHSKIAHCTCPHYNPCQFPSKKAKTPLCVFRLAYIINRKRVPAVQTPLLPPTLEKVPQQASGTPSPPPAITLKNAACPPTKSDESTLM
jgi:hypothetical protein